MWPENGRPSRKSTHQIATEALFLVWARVRPASLTNTPARSVLGASTLSKGCNSANQPVEGARPSEIPCFHSQNESTRLPNASTALR